MIYTETGPAEVSYVVVPEPGRDGRWEQLREHYERIGPGVNRDLDHAVNRGHRALQRIAFVLDDHDAKAHADAEKAKIRADIDRLEAELAAEKAKLRPATKPAPGAAPPTVRDWARANGHTVTARGKIPATVQDAYDQAHPAGDAE